MQEISNSKVRQNQEETIQVDGNQFKSRKCPTPKLDKTPENRFNSMTINLNLGNIQFQSQTKHMQIDKNQCQSRKCPTPELDKTNNKR